MASCSKCGYSGWYWVGRDIGEPAKVCRDCGAPWPVGGNEVHLNVNEEQFQLIISALHEYAEVLYTVEATMEKETTTHERAQSIALARRVEALRENLKEQGGGN